MSDNILNEDRFFSPVEPVRKYAREIYHSIKDLPIISPHGHVDPSIFSENKPFPNPTQLFIIPDHYLYRMLYSQGIPMESLGIPTMTDRKETNPEKYGNIVIIFYLVEHRCMAEFSLSLYRIRKLTVQMLRNFMTNFGKKLITNLPELFDFNLSSHNHRCSK
jgi:hypothetical protein